MKKLFPYYFLNATIRCGDKPWPEYPHVYLANMQLTQDAIVAFTRIFGRLFEQYEPLQPPPKTHIQQVQDAAAGRHEREVMDLRMVRGAQAALRGAWIGNPEYLKAIAGHDPEQNELIYGAMKPVISVTDTGIELIASDVWTFARLAFLYDYASGKNAICANPDCTKNPQGTSYFVRTKHGQKFCCHRCAVLVNVRSFRKNPKNKVKVQSTEKRPRI
jgi:hypothetical protein